MIEIWKFEIAIFVVPFVLYLMWRINTYILNNPDKLRSILNNYIRLMAFFLLLVVVTSQSESKAFRIINEISAEMVFWCIYFLGGIGYHIFRKTDKLQTNNNERKSDEN